MDKEDVFYIYIHTHIHSGILLSHKIEWNNAIWNNIGGPRDYHSKWSKLDRGREISWYHLYVES